MVPECLQTEGGFCFLGFSSPVGSTVETSGPEFLGGPTQLILSSAWPNVCGPCLSPTPVACASTNGFDHVLGAGCLCHKSENQVRHLLSLCPSTHRVTHTFELFQEVVAGWVSSLEFFFNSFLVIWNYQTRRSELTSFLPFTLLWVSTSLRRPSILCFYLPQRPLPQ